MRIEIDSLTGLKFYSADKTDEMLYSLVFKEISINRAPLDRTLS